MYRVGLGYDIHRKEKSRKLFLGGLLISKNNGLVGHSDADVLIHSICDAILGALNEGDIGEHFSDKDPKNKNKKSSIFLKKIMKILKDNNYEVCNIDSTVICEKPNLKAYKKKIQNSLSLIMKINPNKISIKATTHEKLGEIGNDKAIASKSIVLIQKNA